MAGPETRWPERSSTPGLGRSTSSGRSPWLSRNRRESCSVTRRIASTPAGATRSTPAPPPPRRTPAARVAAEERLPRGAAGLDEGRQAGRALVGDQVQAGHDGELVAGQVVTWPREVGGHVGVEQRTVERLQLVELIQLGRRLRGQLER